MINLVKDSQQMFPTLSGIGWIMLFPGRDEGGRSMDIYTRLPRHQMETFKQILMIVPD